MLWQYELTRSTFNHAGFTIDSCCMPLVWQYKTKKVQIYTQKYLGKLFFYSYRLFLLHFKILPCSEEILSCALILKKCSVHFCCTGNAKLLLPSRRIILPTLSWLASRTKLGTLFWRSRSSSGVMWSSIQMVSMIPLQVIVSEFYEYTKLTTDLLALITFLTLAGFKS